MSLLRIVDHYHVEVQKRHILLSSCFHHTDAPVDISRITILLIIGRSNSKVCAGIEGLMTDQHALTEGLPGEVFWGREASRMQEMALTINDVRITVKNGREWRELRVES